MDLRVTPAFRVEQLLLGLLVALLVGCTSALMYRHADWLVLWKLDQYFDLTAEQKGFLSGRLKAILARHQQEALPRYESFLTQLRTQFQDGLTLEEVDWIMASYQEQRADLFERIVTDGVVFLASVEEPQLRHLEQRLQRDHQKAARLLHPDVEHRVSERATATVDWLRDWVGPLAEAQEQRIIQLSRALPDTQAAWLEYRAQRDQDLVLALQSRRNPEALEERLRAWLAIPETRAPPAYQRALEQMRAAVKQMALTVDHMLTPDQRAHALAKLQRLIDTVHELATS